VATVTKSPTRVSDLFFKYIYHLSEVFVDVVKNKKTHHSHCHLHSHRDRYATHMATEPMAMLVRA